MGPDLGGFPLATALKRGADPAEVARVIAFLASGQASYVTGRRRGRRRRPDRHLTQGTSDAPSLAAPPGQARPLSAADDRLVDKPSI